MTEINVTSPTGIQEVRRFGGADIAALIWDAIERPRQRDDHTSANPRNAARPRSTGWIPGTAFSFGDYYDPGL